MSLNTFEALSIIPIRAEAKYVLTTLAIMADDYGRVANFNPRQIEELCDLGPRTVYLAINELCQMQYIQFLDKDFVCLKLPHVRGVHVN